MIGLRVKGRLEYGRGVVGALKENVCFVDFMLLYGLIYHGEALVQQWIATGRSDFRLHTWTASKPI